MNFQRAPLVSALEIILVGCALCFGCGGNDSPDFEEAAGSGGTSATAGAPGSAGDRPNAGAGGTAPTSGGKGGMGGAVNAGGASGVGGNVGGGPSGGSPAGGSNDGGMSSAGTGNGGVDGDDSCGANGQPCCPPPERGFWLCEEGLKCMMSAAEHHCAPPMK